jgi:hypothetical protein
MHGESEPASGYPVIGSSGQESPGIARIGNILNIPVFPNIRSGEIGGGERKREEDRERRKNASN